MTKSTSNAPANAQEEGKAAVESTTGQRRPGAPAKSAELSTSDLDKVAGGAVTSPQPRKKTQPA